MTNEDYVRDPRFQALCLAVRSFDNQVKPEVIHAPGIKDWCEHQDWDDTAVIMQHAQFDGFILSDISHAPPSFIFAPLSMAPSVNGPIPPASLAALAERY